MLLYSKILTDKQSIVRRVLSRIHTAIPLIIIVLCIILGVISFQSIMFKQQNIDKQVKSGTMYSLDEEYYIYSDFILPNTDGLNQVRECIKNSSLYQNDYYIVLTNNMKRVPFPYSMFLSNNVIGATFRQSKVIYLQNDCVEQCCYHELAHTFDYHHNFSNSDTFGELYKTTKHKSYMGTYANRNAREFFAEGYQRYMQKKLSLATERTIIDYYENLLNSSSDK